MSQNHCIWKCKRFIISFYYCTPHNPTGHHTQLALVTRSTVIQCAAAAKLFSHNSHARAVHAAQLPPAHRTRTHHRAQQFPDPSPKT